MSIKTIVRRKMMSSSKGQIIFYWFRIFREKYSLLTKSDEKLLGQVYRKRFGKNLNLSNPQTLSEKLQWLKLFYRDDEIVRCSDKYTIHEYLKEKGYGYLSNELIGVYDDAKDIDFSSLPNKFVAKATHGSGWNLICTDKMKLNWNDEVTTMNLWLKLNLFVFGREWNYREIKPRIVIEKYIEHEPLYDYKFMCFNGKPLYMQLNNDHDGVHYVDFYDLETWEHLPTTYMHYRRSGRAIEKPKKYDEMLAIAKELSKPFPFVRVDFYNFDNTILIGELTFFPAGGLWPFIPIENGFNEMFGDKLQLPEPNFNIELFNKIAQKKV